MSFNNLILYKIALASRDTIGRIPTNQKLLNDLLEMLGEFRSAISCGYTRQIYTETQLKRRHNLFVSSGIEQHDNKVNMFFSRNYIFLFCLKQK